MVHRPLLCPCGKARPFALPIRLPLARSLTLCPIFLSFSQEIAKAKPIDDFMAITLDYVRSECLFLSDRKYYISDAWIKEARSWGPQLQQRVRPRMPAVSLGSAKRAPA